MQKKTLLLLIPGSVIVIILFVSILAFLGIPVYPLSREYCSGHHMIPSYFFLIFGVLLIFASMPLSYYFSSKKMEEKLDKHMDILLKFIGKTKDKKKGANIVDRQSVLKFLNANERKILEKLFESKGSILQSEISRMHNMTKLKTHRAVKNLEQKEIIRTQPYGKTKKIFLTKNIEKLLDV